MRKLPDGLKVWIRRLLIAAAILSVIGYFTDPVVPPLMCKIYG